LMTQLLRSAWRNAHGRGRCLLQRGLISLPTSTSIPLAHSLSLEEFGYTAFGGASAYNHLEQGASIEVMVAFWRRMSLKPGLAIRLAERAEAEGGVWGDPQTLHKRLHALEQLLPAVPAETLLERAPGLVKYRPETLRRKLEDLAMVLPNQDVLRMAATYPTLLHRDVSLLIQRIAALRDHLPRRDIDQLIISWPVLLKLSDTQITERARTVREAFNMATWLNMPQHRLAMLLLHSAARLRRLVQLTDFYPGICAKYSRRKLLCMTDEMYQRRFQPKRMTPARLSRARLPVQPLRPISATDVPRGSNVFRAGEAHYALSRQQLIEDVERVNAMLAGSPKPDLRAKACRSTRLKPLQPSAY